MDKINSSSPQTMPLWERQKNVRGHRSAVDGALEAHRQRTSERQARVQDRLNMVRGMQNQFFPEPQIAQAPVVSNESVQLQAIQSEPEVIADPLFNPRQIDNMYEDAQLGNTSDNALIVIDKEISNPEEGPVEDIPKGSYIDYNV